MEDLVSVIMLTFNRENYVGRMIDCILAQSYQNFEFIIVDNGSTDRSGAIAEEYAAKDPRIRVLHRSRGNIGSGRNAGLDIARGKYVGFVDDDDTCTPDYLAFLLSLARENGTGAAICGATWAEYDEKRIMNSEEAIETLLWRRRYNVAFPTKLFRRDLFAKNRFLETGKYDDIYLMPKILADAGTIAYHGLSKYHFERHDHNNSAWTQNHRLLDRETLEEYLTVYRDRTVWLTERFPNSAAKWRYFNWSFMISMVEKISRLRLIDCYEIRNVIAEELKMHREEFLNGGYALDFEKKWMEQYLTLNSGQ